MALPTTGAISFSDIMAELGLDENTPDTRLASLENGDYVTINLNSSDRPDGNPPHSLSEWYRYNHEAQPAYSNTRYYQNDGTSDYINCTTSTSPFDINTTQDLSFSMWVRHTGTKANQLLFNFGNTNANGNNRIFVTYSHSLNRLIFRIRTNSVNFDKHFALHDNTSATGLSNSSSGWSSTSRGNVNSDNFCMLTFTYDASQSTAASAFKMYWNNTECTSTANSNNGTRTAITSIRGRIGENLQATNSAGNATLDYDEIKIYNKVLSQSEVTTLYNSGAIIDSSALSSGLITEWTFENNNANDSNSKYTNSIVGGNIATY